MCFMICSSWQMTDIVSLSHSFSQGYRDGSTISIILKVIDILLSSLLKNQVSTVSLIFYSIQKISIYRLLKNKSNGNCKCTWWFYFHNYTIPVSPDFLLFMYYYTKLYKRTLTTKLNINKKSHKNNQFK